MKYCDTLLQEMKKMKFFIQLHFLYIYTFISYISDKYNIYIDI